MRYQCAVVEAAARWRSRRIPRDPLKTAHVFRRRRWRDGAAHSDGPCVRFVASHRALAVPWFLFLFLLFCLRWADNRPVSVSCRVCARPDGTERVTRPPNKTLHDELAEANEHPVVLQGQAGLRPQRSQGDVEPRPDALRLRGEPVEIQRYKERAARSHWSMANNVKTQVKAKRPQLHLFQSWNGRCFLLLFFFLLFFWPTLPNRLKVFL